MPSILLLDDEPNVVSALRRTLRTPLGDSVNIEMFTDPHDALARVGEQHFDLIVSDFRMPALDGVQFLRFVREIQPDAMRMIVSASSEIGGILSAINDIGVFRYVIKPWAARSLVWDVREALATAAARRDERRMADAMRSQMGEFDGIEMERRRLEEDEPGITRVDWGPNGEVLMPAMHFGAH